MSGRIRVGEILIRAGVIDQHQLKSALGEQRRWGKPLGATLVKMGFVEERDLVRALASQLALPVASLEGKRIAPQVLDLVPAKLALEHMVLPLFVKKDERRTTVFLAMEDPGDLAVLDDLAFRTGMQIKPVMMAPSELAEGVDRYYRDRPKTQPAVRNVPDRSEITGQALERLAAETSKVASAKAPDAHVSGTEELVRHFKIGAVPDDRSTDDLHEDEPAPGAVPEASVSASSPVADREATPAPARTPEPQDTVLGEGHLAAPPPRKPLAAGEESLAHPPIESLASYEAKTRTILHVLTQLLIEKGVISRDEFHERVTKLSEIDRQAN